MGTFKAICLDVYDPHLQLEAEDPDAPASRRTARPEAVTLHVIERLACRLHIRETPRSGRARTAHR